MSVRNRSARRWRRTTRSASATSLGGEGDGGVRGRSSPRCPFADHLRHRRPRDLEAFGDPSLDDVDVVLAQLPDRLAVLLERRVVLVGAWSGHASQTTRFPDGREPGGPLVHRATRWASLRRQTGQVSSLPRSTGRETGVVLQQEVDRNRRFEDKVVFISGAARGQGSSHAVGFAREGARIIGVDMCSDLEHAPYPLATEEDLAETVRVGGGRGRGDARRGGRCARLPRHEGRTACRRRALRPPGRDPRQRRHLRADAGAVRGHRLLGRDGRDQPHRCVPHREGRAAHHGGAERGRRDRAHVVDRAGSRASTVRPPTTRPSTAWSV